MNLEPGGIYFFERQAGAMLKDSRLRFGKNELHVHEIFFFNWKIKKFIFGAKYDRRILQQVHYMCLCKCMSGKKF